MRGIMDSIKEQWEEIKETLKSALSQDFLHYTPFQTEYLKSHKSLNQNTQRILNKKLQKLPYQPPT